MKDDEESYSLIEYQVIRDLDQKNRYYIEGTQQTIKLFLDLMEKHIVSHGINSTFVDIDRTRNN